MTQKPKPKPTPKPYYPGTGSTLTPAQKKAKAAKEAAAKAAAAKKSAAAKAKSQQDDTVYSWGPGGLVYVESKTNQFPKHTIDLDSVPEGPDKKTLTVQRDKVNRTKAANTNLRRTKSREKQSAYWNAKSVRNDFGQAKRRYDNAYKAYQDNPTPENKKTLTQTQNVFNTQRQKYIDVFQTDPVSPDELQKPVLQSPRQQEAANLPETLEQKAKQDSLNKTKTLEDSRVKSGLDGVYSADDGKGNIYYYWKGNSSDTSYVYLVGDPNGKYVPNTVPNQAYKTGSPVGAQEYVDRTIERYQRRPGGIRELKQMLANKGAYADDATAARSLSTGDMRDGQLYSALRTALNSITSANLQRLSQTKNKNVSLIDLNGWFNSPGKLPNSTAIGNGMNGTVVQHQSFRPEEYEIAIDQMFQATIGRGASDAELNDFLGKLREYEKSHPQSTTYTGQGTGSETSVTGGGVDENVARSLMRDEALANPEAEKNAKENKYFNYLMEAITPTTTSQLG